MRRMLKTLPDSDSRTYRFFARATSNFDSLDDNLRVLISRWESSKNESGVIVAGTAASTKPQAKVYAGGTWEEQPKCKSNDVVHNSKERRWCIKPKITQITDLVLCEDLEVTTSPDQ